MRRLAWILTILVLLVTGVLGVYDGIADQSGAEDALQLSVTYGVLAYGVLALRTVRLYIPALSSQGSATR